MVSGRERALGMMTWVLVGNNETGIVQQKQDLEEVLKGSILTCGV